MRVKTCPALRILVACFAVVLLLPPVVGAAAPTRVVAVGDVHGAYSQLVAILQHTGLIDGDRQWAGGSTTLVQTGDVIDRGTQSRACLDLLMELQRQAERAGGKVVPLLGNHEAMNVMGDLRYVTAEIFRTFATDQSEKVREQALQDYVKFLSAHKDHSHAAVPPGDEAARRKWTDAHPPGFFEYYDAFGSEGKYGRWIRSHHAVVQIGEGVFVHGGLNPSLKFRNVAELDDQVRSELTGFDSLWRLLADKKVIWRYMTLTEAVQYVGEELKWVQARGPADDPEAVQAMQKLLGYSSWMAASSDGPLWYRGLAQEPEEKLMGGVTAMLARLKALYIVEGHTVLSKSDITPRFDNHVFLIDTGMLKEAYDGRATALEILEGKFTAYYADGAPKSLAAPRSGKTDPAGKPEFEYEAVRR
ncbi:MAG: metallophosphoesterase [Acidobacteriia bacterium]|nr:metallophosphoesterase [Terriglobia bacterium]